jgi:arginyl-tRNA synthetase
VRATNIFRKGGLDPDNFSPGDIEFGNFLSTAVEERPLQGRVTREPGPDAALKGPLFHNSDELWELWLTASKTAYVIDQCIATTEPAYLAKHVFQLAQMFNTFYHRYPILSEEDAARKQFLLATAAVVRRELIRALGVMGIDVPPVM